MKNFSLAIALFICWIHNFNLAQDTLEFKDGQFKYGRVIGVDTKLNILEFKNAVGQSFISIENLKKYTSNEIDEKWVSKTLFTFSVAESKHVIKIGSNKKLLDFNPSKYGVGVNLMSLFDPVYVNDFDNFGRTYSTNRYFECFFQTELNPGVALRFPVRIGISPLKEAIVNPSNDFYGRYSRELIGDIGFEPIFYFNRNNVKLKWFAGPSLSIVAGRSVSRILNSDINTTTYVPIDFNLSYRIGVLTGFQYWFGPRFQFESTFGYFVTNNYWQPDDFNQPGKISKRPFFGRNLRLALIYRFNG
ncbi:MAG: YjbH domain-containing protein [Flavobacteriales bacterium]|nr:YjbH domain-containing protein [Flavobacteriales bacterium]